MHKIVSLLLVGSILASVTAGVNAYNEVTDIKKYILLDMTQDSGIDEYDTNNDGRIDVFDLNRIKKRIINNTDLPSETASTQQTKQEETSALQTQPTVTSASQTQQTAASTLHTQPSVSSALHTQPLVTSAPQTQPSVSSALQTQPAVTSEFHTQPATTSAVHNPPATTSTLRTVPTTTQTPQTTQPVTSAPQTSKTTVTTTNTQPAAPGLDEKSIYNAMIAFKTQYPEGTPWTNNNSYVWNGGIYNIGYGCAGFAFMLSDAAFGKLPARKITNADVTDIRVGDILRVNNDTHSVIVLQITDEGFVLAEGNYNSKVHWGRKLTWTEAKNTLTYVMTRYPD